jgi:hypothetical protein
MKTITFNINDIQLLIDDKNREAFEAFASVSLNPHLTWIKFVLTDDKPNANGHRIPKEEFANIIKTGVYMPLKMAEGEISEGHEGTIPLGVMTHLVDREDRIEALAALWLREREDDIDFLKERFESGKDIDISWEISFEKTREEDGHMDLGNVSMNAATIVGMPSYMGRTNVQALAAKKKLEDDSNMDNTITLDKHEEILAGLRESHDDRVSELETQLTEATENSEELETKVSEAEKELETLREFKESVDAEAEREAKMASIKAEFEEAELNTSDDYFEERKEQLLAMSDEQREFFIQELVSLRDAEAAEEEEEASITGKTPPFRGKEADDDVDGAAVLEYLREQDKS